MAGKETLAPEARFKIPRVSEALCSQTRDALAKKGFTFVVAIEPVSIGQLVTDEATSQRFDFVHSSENMRAIVPPQMELAINPKILRIRRSNSKSTNTQIKMIQEREQLLNVDFPKKPKR